MLIPVSAGLCAEALFFQIKLMLIVPSDKAYYPAISLLMTGNSMELTYYLPQLYTGSILGAHRKPDAAHALYMNQTALQNHILTGCPDSHQQCSVPVTGYALYLDTKTKKVLQVFLYFLIPFTICKPVQLGVPDVIIPVEHQTEITAEVCGIYEQIYLL